MRNATQSFKKTRRRSVGSLVRQPRIFHVTHLSTFVRIRMKGNEKRASSNVHVLQEHILIIIHFFRGCDMITNPFKISCLKKRKFVTLTATYYAQKKNKALKEREERLKILL